MALQKDIGKISPVIVEPVPQGELKEADLSGARYIERLGKAGIALGTKIYGDSLRDEIESDIDIYLSSEQQQVEAIRDLPAAVENSALLQEQTGEFSGLEEDGEFFNDPVVMAAREEVATLSDAVEAGVMSQSTLNIRVQQKMRQYINSAPGLSQYFRQISAQTMGDYKAVIDATNDAQVAQAKSLAASRKSTITMGNKLYIDPALQASWNEYATEVSKAVAREQGSIDIVKETERLEFDKKAKQEHVRKTFSNKLEFDFFKVRGAADRIMANPDMDKATKKQMLRELQQQYVGSMKVWGTSDQALTGTEVDNRIAHRVSRLGQYLDAVDDKDLLASLKSKQEIDAVFFENKLYETFPELRQQEMIVDKLGITIPIQNVPGGIEAIGGVFRAISNKNPFSLGALTPEPKSDAEKDMVAAYYEQSKSFLSQYEPNDLLKPSQVAGLYNGPMMNWDVSELPEDSQVEGMFNFVASEQGLNGLKMIQASGDRINREEMEYTFNRFVNERWKPNLASVWNRKVGQTGVDDIDEVGDFVDAKLDTTTGQLKFVLRDDISTAEDPEVFRPFVMKNIRYLNQEVAQRYNSLIRAKAHLANPNSPNYLEASKQMFVDLALERKK